MKLLGILAIILCCTMTGMYMASSLSSRVLRIENSIALLSALHDRLQYLQPPMGPLIEGLASQEQFAATRYLTLCRDHMRRGDRFSVAWRKGLEAEKAELGGETVQVLLQLEEVLGSTDLESQLTSIRYVRELLENRLEQARDYRERHGKLYRSLGLLGGIGLAIILV